MIARQRVENGAVVLAIMSLAIWIGGWVALGACAAPIVFRVVPAPHSGDAMGAVFQRFDVIAMTCAVIVLACEAVRIRTDATAPGARAIFAARARTALAVIAALAAIYGGIELSPRIVALHSAGAVRGLGADGTELERLHRWAESVAKIEVTAGLFLLALHVTTLRRTAEPAA
jgi:hypothetical protein